MTQQQQSSQRYGPEDGLLAVDGLTKHFGGLTAVEDFSLVADSDEILGLIGPNGAGKSTTFNCVTGLFPPSSGTVWFDGVDITGLPLHEVTRAGIGRTFQDFRPFNDRTVVENIMVPLSSLHRSSLFANRSSFREEALDICDTVGLQDDIEKTPGELPHEGMTRLELGRALATDPDLLLVDEPFAGLTVTETKDLATVMTRLHEEDIAMIVIDHNLRGLFSLVDRVVVIHNGRKLTEGTPREVQEDTDVQKAYLGGSKV